jgi:hypothetical protein
MEKRKFTKEEQLKIIKEALEQGIKLPLEKYSLFPRITTLKKRKWE